MTIKQILFLTLVFGSVFSNNLLEANRSSIDPERLPIIMMEANDAADERYMVELLQAQKHGKISLAEAIGKVSFANILLEEHRKALAKESAFNNMIARNLQLNHKQQ